MIPLRRTVTQLDACSEFMLGEDVEVVAERLIKFAAFCAAAQGWTNSQFMPGAE